MSNQTQVRCRHHQYPGVNKLHEHFDERKKRVDEIGPFSSNMVRVPDPQRKNNAFCEAIVYIHLQEGEGKDKLTAMVVAGGGQVTSDITHPHINVFVCAHLISIPDAAKECQQRGGHIVSVDWVINSDWRDICLPLQEIYRTITLGISNSKWCCDSPQEEVRLRGCVHRY